MEKLEVKNYSIENMGGGCLAYFGEFKNGLFFSGNEEVLNISKKSDKFLYLSNENVDFEKFYNEYGVKSYTIDEAEGKKAINKMLKQIKLY